MTWDEAWSVLNADGTLTERLGQRQLGEWVFYVTREGGTLLGEASVGTGKSLAYGVPLVYAVQTPNVRAVVSTETTTLQDQLVDKDLPRLAAIFKDKPFKFAALKGRNWYLCANRAGKGHPLLKQLRGSLGEGQRRDVERILDRRLDDDDWAEVSGESDFCAQAKCKPEDCYGALARKRALDADIVVTNHAMLRTHAEMVEQGLDGPLGDFDHLVVDEAHTLEKVLIDGWGTELRPYDAFKSLESMWDALDGTSLKFTHGGKGEEADKLFKSAIQSVVKLFLLKTGDNDWRREQFAIGQVYLSGNVDVRLKVALAEYEDLGPDRFAKAGAIFRELNKDIAAKVTELRDSGQRVSRKTAKGVTATRRLADVCEMLSESIQTRNGQVTRFGVPYVVVGEGTQAYKGTPDVTIRCVPLDVSDRARETIWKGLTSATLVSGTLRDETDGTFRYPRAALGIDDAHEVVVSSAFNYADNQLVYVTPATDEVVNLANAQFGMAELVETLEATTGRALVLFTANAELEYAAETLEMLRDTDRFSHTVLVQRRGESKDDLKLRFMRDKHSVLLATKSFFTGVDFAGEACSAVVLVKYPRPRWDPVTRAQSAWWAKRGWPQWYTREAMQVFKQANGRLIRNETDRGVIAILDQRASDPRSDISKLIGLEIQSTGCAATRSLAEVKAWLDRVQDPARVIA